MTGADTGRPVGLGFYNNDGDVLLNSITTLTGLSGTVHIDVLDGSAMVFVDGQDLSDYAGSDDGNTPNMIMFIDTAGKVCATYCGAVGGGKTLSAEQQANYDFTTWVGDNPSGFIVLNETAFCKVTENMGAQIISDGTSNVVLRSMVYAPGKIVETTLLVSAVSAGSVALYLGGLAEMISAPQTVTKTITSGSILYAQILKGTVPLDVTLSSWSTKYYTDVPATGIHLIKTINGSGLGIAYKETGFNPLVIDTIKIFNRFTHGNDSDAFDWTGLVPGTSYIWYPKADNGTQIVAGEDVNFTTNTKPYASSLSPADGETVTETDVTLSATFNDDEGGAGSLRFYNKVDDSLIDTATGVADGATGQVTWPGLTPGQEYQFYVIPNDGIEDGAASSTITFTVKSLGRGFSPVFSPIGKPINNPFKNM